MSLFTPQRFPFLRLLLPLVCGIIAYHYFDNNYVWQGCLWASLPLFLLKFAINRKYKERVGWSEGVALFLLTAAIGSLVLKLESERLNVQLPQTVTEYVFTSLDIPEMKNGRTRITAQLNQENTTRCFLYFEKDSLLDSRFPIETTFHAQVKLSPVSRQTNSGYALYCHKKGITHTGFLKKELASVASNPSSTGANGWFFDPSELALSIELQAKKSRNAIISIIRSLPLSTYQHSILIGSLLGDKSAIDQEMVHRFRSLGVSHLLAVSGLHVGIIFSIIWMMLLQLKRRKNGLYVMCGLTFVLLWSYTYIVGLPASAVRASTMLSLYLLSLSLKKRYQSLHALFISAFIILLVDPLTLFDVGFQLSFSAVLFILLANHWLKPYIKIPPGPKRWLMQFVTICVAAQIGVLPLSMYYFGSFQPLFLIPNLMIVPLITILIPLTLLMLLLYGIGIELLFPLTIIDHITTVIHWTTESICHIADKTILHLPFPAWFVAPAYCIIIGLSLYLFDKNKKGLIFALFIISLSLLYSIV